MTCATKLRVSSALLAAAGILWIGLLSVGRFGRQPGAEAEEGHGPGLAGRNHGGELGLLATVRNGFSRAEERLQALEARASRAEAALDQLSASLVLGRASDGQVVKPPSGRVDDWLVVIIPGEAGLIEPDLGHNFDNALLRLNYSATPVPDGSGWRVTARFHMKTSQGVEDSRPYVLDGIAAAAHYVLIRRGSFDGAHPDR